MTDFQTTTLDNGLTFIGETNPDAHTAAIGFFVQAGTRDETRPLMGVSHFLEHMMFKGTERRTADEVNRDFDRIGANYNASTSHEATAYYAHVLPEYLPNAIDILTDMLRPSLRQADFEMEKNVILEEIGMYDDHPFWVAYEQTAADYFADHPLGYRVLGTTDSIKALTAEQMRDYFQHRYSPDNIIVSLAGRLDFEQTVNLIAETCGSWQKTGATRNPGTPTPHRADRKMPSEKVTRHYVVAFSPAPSSQDPDRYPASVLAYALGDSDGSQLYWQLVDPGLADEAEISHHAMDGTGVMLTYASCHPDRAAEVEAKLFHTIDHAAETLTEAEIIRARNKIATGLTLQNERPLGRMLVNGSNWLYLHRHESLEEQLDQLNRVTLDDVRQLLEKYPTTIRAITHLTPKS